MTVVAIVIAGDMGRMFAGRRDAVMAGAANAQYLCVIDRDYRRERNRAVTILTDVGRLHVSLVLACSSSTVMAADAIAEDVGMIVTCRKPARRGVTVVALVPG